MESASLSQRYMPTNVKKFLASERCPRISLEDSDTENSDMTAKREDPMRSESECSV